MWLWQQKGWDKVAVQQGYGHWYQTVKNVTSETSFAFDLWWKLEKKKKKKKKDKVIHDLFLMTTCDSGSVFSAAAGADLSLPSGQTETAAHTES